MERCILLIDDDPDEIDIFSEALAKMKKSIVCIQATGASAAMNLLDSLLPDYIFLDINMPEINGLKCLEEIRKAKTFKDVPIILYSNSINQDIVTKARIAGASACIRKPKKVSTLAEILDCILSIKAELKKVVLLAEKNN